MAFKKRMTALISSLTKFQGGPPSLKSSRHSLCRMMHFIISGNIRKEIRNIMSFTELKKLHWLLSNEHFSVISERALVPCGYIFFFLIRPLEKDLKKSRKKNQFSNQYNGKDRTKHNKYFETKIIHCFYLKKN